MMMDMKYDIYLVVYAPSSPQRLIDIAKLAFHSNIVTGLVIVKPIGMAAQSGIPEISKMAYKLDKKLIILPSMKDLRETLTISDIIFIVDSSHDVPDIEELQLDFNKTMAIVIQGGEAMFSKEDLTLGQCAKISEFLPGFSSAVAEATAAILKIYKKIKHR